MRTTPHDVDEFLRAGVVDAAAASRMRAYIGDHAEPADGFDLTSLAYYAGALVLLVSAGWFGFETFSRWDTRALLVYTFVLTAVVLGVGEWLWRRPSTRHPAGLLLAVAPVGFGVAAGCVLRMTGLWPPLADRTAHLFSLHQGPDAVISLTILATGVAIHRLRPHPFLGVPIGSAMAALSVTIGRVLQPQGARATWLGAQLAGGLATLAIAYLTDLRGDRRLAFWLYLAALLTGLAALYELDPGRWILLATHVALLLAAVLLQRRTFLVFGGLGALFHTGAIVEDLFDSALLSAASLAALGLALVFGGLAYARHRDRIRQSILDRLPPRLRRLVPPG